MLNTYYYNTYEWIAHDDDDASELLWVFRRYLYSLMDLAIWRVEL